MPSPLEIVGQDVWNHLLGDDYFADVPVFFLREETVDAEVSRALAGATFKSAKTGVAVSVLMPVFDVSRPNAPGPHLEPALIVRVQEIPTINQGTTGTKKTAEQIAQRVSQVLLHFMAQGLYGALHPAKDFITPNRNFLPRVTYDVVFQTMMPLEKLERVLMPTIARNGNIVTLACATPGASILYTTDDSLPRRANGGVAQNGTLYAAPFDISGLFLGLPVPLRAAAHVHLSALLPSFASREVWDS